MTGVPKVFTIPAGLAFAEALAEGLIARHGRSPLALADITIYLPTRRAARTFGDAFGRALGGAALLPEFRPLGDVDEDELLFDASSDAIDLPPAIAPIRRKFLLATLIRRWSMAERNESLTFPQAIALADSLAALLGEFETHGADWESLDTFVPESLAQHWGEVRAFLSLLRTQWPALLAAEKAIDPAARRNIALKALAKRLETSGRPVIAAGSTGSIPATAELLRTIANLPQGAVVLPGLDRHLDAEAWDAIVEDPAHPQFGLRQLLARIGVEREQVGDWMSGARQPTPRTVLLSESLRPPPTTDAWRSIAEGDTTGIAKGLDGLSLIESADPNEEAAAIALAMRKSLECPKRTAALVTSDRSLARRVAAEMGRWGIEIDDSAGRPLAHTPPGALLSLIAECVDAKFTPIPLLAMLKHPLATMGGDAAAFRRHARQLDLVLRGPRPNPGVNGVLRKLETRPWLQSWFAKVAEVLAPLAALMEREQAPINDLVEAHIAAAEALAPRLWGGDAGDAAQELLSAMRDAAAEIPEIEPDAYAQLFRMLAERQAVRPAYGRHPRLAILGPLEARLQSFDTIILGGLNEGTWPRPAPPDPWLSRPMRAAIGLDAPERAIGLAAHDFETLAAKPSVILTRATKVEGTPTVASRWVQRLTQLTGGLGFDRALKTADGYLDIARSLASVREVRRAKRPAPTPPVETRPRKLSITETETWRRDPYAIYAKRILTLRPLDPIDAEIGPLERGNIVHRALEKFITEFKDRLPKDAARRLIAIADELFREEELPHAVLSIWQPRFANAAGWFVEEERERRAEIAEMHVEVDGTLTLPGPAGDFVLHGRADRIDILKTGGVAIIDYKTGQPPTDKQVKALLSPQLPLEGAIVAAGGVLQIGKRTPEDLIYVKFSGGMPPGDIHAIKANPAQIADLSAQWLVKEIARYDDVATGYLSRAIAFKRAFAGDYDHLGRVGEWAVAASDEDEE